MKIGVISDTHAGTLDDLPKPILTTLAGVDLIVQVTRGRSEIDHRLLGLLRERRPHQHGAEQAGHEARPAHCSRPRGAPGSRTRLSKVDQPHPSLRAVGSGQPGVTGSRDALANLFGVVVPRSCPLSRLRLP